MTRRRRAGWAALAWAALVFGASVMPAPPPVAPDLPLDKIFHALFYFPLGALFFWRLVGRGKPAGAWAVAALAAGLYGLGIEGVQWFLPWRSFEWLDAAMDLAGGAAGATIGRVMAGLPAVRGGNS